jgi:hypothetical protein
MTPSPRLGPGEAHPFLFAPRTCRAIRGNFSGKADLGQNRGKQSQIVLRGLDPRIHVFVSTDPRRGCPRIKSVG